MKTLKSRKAKILLCTIAIVLIVSVLATTLLACKKTVVNETPDEVFFVGDLQKNLSAEEISAITAEGETVVFDDVLFVDGNVPAAKSKVEAKVLKQGKNRKLKIFKYVNKNNKHRKTQGHRQPYTKIEVTKIVK